MKEKNQTVRPFNVTMTLGPASESLQVRQRLLRTATRFRINTSFYAPMQIKKVLQALAGLFRDCRQSLPVVLDLQGSKMRIGNYIPCKQLPERVVLTFLQSTATAGTATEVIPVPHRELFEQCQPGDCLLLNDARILLKVLLVKEAELEAEVIRNGPLSRFKSINCQTHPLRFSRLREEDRAMIEAAAGFDFVQYAYSFVHTGEEGRFLRELTRSKLIAKIERPEAFLFLKEIALSFDELWFCRGDLGAQAGLHSLAALQREFCNTTREFQVETALAGQVLEYMTHFPEPTRAEVVQLYEALAAGFKGIVLSDETAIGKNPGKVADYIDSISNS